MEVELHQVWRMFGSHLPPREGRLRLEVMINPQGPGGRVECRHGRPVRSRWWSATVVAVGLVTALAAGCGGNETHAGDNAETDAGSVALRYSQALFAGRFSQASQYVVPSTDVETDNPMFRVQLTRQVSGRWLVSFKPTPPASGSSAPKQPSARSTAPTP